jgi:hypothetical protein
MNGRLRTILPLIAAVVATLAPPAANPQARPAKPACSHKGSRTVLATDQARIYRQTGRTESGDLEYLLRGCLYRTNRRVLLAEGSGDGLFEQVESLRLAGRFAAFGVTGSIKALTLGSAVRVVDLRRRKRRDAAPRQNPFKTFDLELKRNGSVAWIAGPRPGFAATGPFQVFKTDASGRQLLLASGDDIDPRSLALSGSHVYWTQGGAPFSALLH